MRYVYALAADGPGAYLRMTAVSSLSVRAWDAKAHITLLTDDRSLGALTPFRSRFDEVVVADAPDSDARVRSRYLKTAMRNLVSGDFLFLDGDTIVCGDLAPLAKTAADLAAVADQHRTTPALADVEERIYGACDWPRPSRVSLNSGVLYWRDTSAARETGTLWREKWEVCRKITGRHNDQQALNSALEEGSATCAELPAEYNAQVGLRPETAFGARVWHVFASDRRRVPTMRTVFDPYWDGRAPLYPPTISQLFFRPHPFAVDGPLDAAVVRLLARRRLDGNLTFNDWRRLWLAGERAGALAAINRAGRALVRRRAGALIKRSAAAMNRAQ